MTVSRYVFNWTIDFIRSCQNWTPNWMEIKKYATHLLPDWTKDCPFQIKGIAIKEATTAFFKVKGKPQFRSRKTPQQSCFIHKTAMFLAKNFELILLPTFETQAMSSKAGRKIRSKSVRSMLSFAHYRFKQFIKHKAFEYGKRVVDINEAYTSKTHPETGEVRNIGSAKLIKLLSGKWVNRDLVGVLLRDLVDTPQSADWQLVVV